MATESRYSVSTKIFFIAASYSLPIAVLVWLMVSSINSNITFARQELAGNAYQRPLFALLTGVQGHQLASRRCGDNACEPSSRVGSAIEASLAELDQVHSRFGGQLQFTPDGLAKRARVNATPAKLREQWGAILKSTGAARDKAYDELTANIRTLITHAGDTSNLILDPDLDSYYLMDVTLLALPQMQDRMGRIGVAGFDAASSGQPLTVQQRADFVAHASMLAEADAARVQASSETSMNEDNNFYGPSATLSPALRPALAAWNSSQAAFGSLVKRMANGEPVSGAALLQASADAREKSQAYWNVGVDELDKLLAARIASYQGDRAKALFWAAFATLGAALLSVFLMRSITKPLDELVRMLGPGATLLSSSVERIAETSRDRSATPEEAEIICEELNAHADKMREAVLELAKHVQGSDAESRMEQATGTRPA